jgi:acetyl-CoA carboxylase biotin carboxyl carrier protein
VDVRSQMTAAVLTVDVAVGDEVAEGQTLLVVESMKMEIPVVAPGPGRVTLVGVDPADIVAEGDILVVLE